MIVDAFNWFFSYDTRTPAQKRGLEIVYEKDYFSEMIPDIFMVLASKLPVKDMKALHIAVPKIRPVTALLINADTQKKLEDLILNRRELNSYLKDLVFEPDISNYLEKAKSLKNYSEERIQILRNAICFILLDKQWDIKTFDLQRRVYSFFAYTYENSEAFFDIDFKLSIQILKEFFEDRKSLKCYYQDYKEHLYYNLHLKALTINALIPKRLEIDIDCKEKKGPLNEKFLNLLFKALQNNHSIQELSIQIQDWNLNHLIIILETVKKIERINRIDIDEKNMDYYSQFAASWKHPESYSWFQSRHISKLTNIMIDQLGPISTNIFRYWNTVTWKRY